MAKMIIADLTPEEAAKIQEMINTILEELHNREMSLDPTLFAERMAAAINAGERSFERIKALTLGPEAAPAQRAN